MENKKWAGHNSEVRGQALPPSTPLQMGLDYWRKKVKVSGLTAADLGCGSGVDTFALLEEGFHVLAIDKDAPTLSDLLVSYRSIYPSYPAEQLTIDMQAFESLKLPPVQWVNASFALPFCSPEHFPACWQEVRNALLPGGLFSGHFLGVKDSWLSRPGMTFLEKEEIKALFDGFGEIWFNETEKEGVTVNGGQKHWHVFSLVAVKQGG